MRILILDALEYNSIIRQGGIIMSDDFFDDIDPDYIDDDDYFDEEYSEDGLDPDEIEDVQDEYDENLADEEVDESEFEPDENIASESDKNHLNFGDPFWLGVAAGFGYEMGREEKRKKKLK